MLTALSAGCSGKVEVGQVSSTSPTSASAAEQAVTVDKEQLAAKAKEKLEEAAGQESRAWSVTATSTAPSAPPSVAC